jgi:hypothetical protein
MAIPDDHRADRHFVDSDSRVRLLERVAHE